MKTKISALLFFCFGFLTLIANGQSTPVLKWGTYYGGPSPQSTTNNDYGAAVACDGLGNVYACGHTSTTQDMTTTGAFKTTFSGYIDAYLVKFNCAGERVWGTYYGGDTLDKTYGGGLAVDREGNVYMTGSTNSTKNIATAGAHKTAPDGYDAFLVKFDSTGKRLWGTYFGGSKDENSWGSIACDAMGNIYITGSTKSPDGIATVNAQQGTLDGSQDGFLAKFDKDGKLLWSTYYGGDGPDDVLSITCDAEGNVYIGGSTGSKGDSTHIATAGAHKTGITGSPGKGGTYPNDGFLAQFSGEGVRQWGTYFGGDKEDEILSVAMDRYNHLYVTGTTNSPSDISTSSSYQPAKLGNTDAFLGRFDASGNYIWGTYYGDSTNTYAGDVTCDLSGNAIMLGYVQELSMSNGGKALATPGSYQTQNAGYIDVFVARFDSTGKRNWGTYYGGTGAEDHGAGDHGVACDGLGNIYFTGLTGSQTGIATTGSFEENGGLSGRFTGGDAFLARFSDSCALLAPPAALTDNDSVCPKGTHVYSVVPVCDISKYAWMLPDGSWKGSSNTDMITATAGIVSGNNAIRVAAINACGDTGLFRTIMTYVYPYNHPVINVNGFILSTTNNSSYTSWQWFLNDQLIPGATDSTYNVTKNGDYTVAIVDINGCTDTSSIYTVSNVTGLRNRSASAAELRVFPNPAHDMLYIKAPQKVNLTITGIEGRIIKQQLNTSAISIKGLSSGMYLLHISNQSGSVIKTEKFIKASDRD